MVARWRSRWRGAPVGVTSSRRWSPLASRRIWPSRPTRRRREVASVTPRPTAPTAGCCASCSPMGRLPASWIPPTIVLEWRERVRLCTTLVDQRSTWVQRIHAELYQHGVAPPELRWSTTRQPLESDGIELSPAGRQRVLTAFRMIDAITVESLPLKADLQRFGLRQPRCRALVDSQYGIGGLLAVAMWSELGDCQRFDRSDQVVRHSGRDVSVDASDRRRAGGFLPRQGPPTLRWALYEAAKNASHQRSPDTTTTATSRSTSTASRPPSRWPASSLGAASTCCGQSTPTSSTRHPDTFRRG